MEKGRGGGDPSYKYGKCLYTLNIWQKLIGIHLIITIIFTIICSKLMKGLVQKSHFRLKYVTFISVNLNWSCVWLFLPCCFLLLFKISCECQFAYSIFDLL